MAAPTAGIAGAIDPALQRDIESLAVPGLLIGHRLISPGDEDAVRLYLIAQTSAQAEGWVCR